MTAKLDGARVFFAALKSAASLGAAGTALQAFSLRLDEMAQNAHEAGSR